MKRQVVCGAVVGVVALAAMVGCGGADPSPTGTSTLKLQGTVSPTARRLDNARAIAVTRSGKAYWSYLDAHGDFTLTLPKGVSYRVLIANARAAGGKHVIGHLVIATSAGASKWVGVHSGGTLDLGTLGLASSGGGVRTLHDEGSGGSSGKSDDSDHHGDDNDCHEDDHEDDDVCSEKESEHDDDKDVELHADNDPHDSCKDDDDHEGDDNDHESEKPCAGGDAGSPPPSPPPPPQPPPPGGTCNTAADCAAGDLCVASHCVAPPR